MIIGFCLQHPTSFGQAVGCHGTLVSLISTCEGLLIAADRRQYDSIRGDVDDVTKLFPLDNGVVFFTTGTSSYVNSSDFRELFNADKIISAQLSNVESVELQTLQKLAMEIDTTFKSFLRALPRADFWPTSGSDFDNAIFQAVICEYSVTEKKYIYHVIRYTYVNRYPAAETNVTYSKQEIDFTNAKYYGFGNIAVYQEIVNGHHPDFDGLRENKQIKRFFFNTPLTKDVSIKEAVKFLRYFTAESSRLTHLVDNNSPNHIGPQVDLLLLNDAGAKWLK